MKKSKYTNQVNRTKLYRPPSPSDYISRDALESRLDYGTELPLTLVCAPAGYGKSTLVSHWLENRMSTNALASAWISLDEADSDVRVFLTYFVAALRTVSAVACKEVSDMLNAESLPPLPIIATQLSNNLDALDERLILVLDDYHQINDADINFLISSLLGHPSRNLHLVILARRDPALALAQLRAYHLLNEIRMQDLKFTSEDTLAYLVQSINFPLQEKNIRRLQNSTEGWPVGIRLAALALAHQDNVEEYLNNFSTNSRPMQEYLVSEVLSVQPVTVQNCLLNISILDRFNVELCEALCSRETDGKEFSENGQEFINILESSGLFCIALDGGGQWYRFHHLFADLLQKQLEEIHGKENIANLHNKASHWFAGNGYVEDAIQHALAGNDVAAAAKIVGAARHELMNKDQWHGLGHWLNMFSYEAIQQHAHLVVLRCWIDLYHSYRLDYLVKDLNQADTLLQGKSIGAAEDKSLKAEVAAIRCNLAYWILEPESGVTLGDQVLQDAPVEHECVRSTALFGLGALYQMLGNVPKCEQVIWDHMEDGRFNSASSRARLLLPLCMTYWPEADTQKLLKAATGMMQIGVEHALPWSQSFACYFFGLIHYEKNELDEAVAHLKSIVDDPYRYPIQNVVHCAFLLSLSYQALGLVDRALEVADSISKYTFERGNMMFIGLSEAFHAELDLRQGRIVQAEHWVNNFVLPAPHALQRFFNAELTSIRVQMALDTPQSRAAAAEQLEIYNQLVIQINHRRLKIDILGMKALLAEAEGDTDAAVALLHEAVVLGQPGQIVRPLADLGKGLVKLLNRLDLNQEGLQYVGKIISAVSDASEEPAEQPVNGILSEALSARELEILDLFARNLSNKAIAEQLFISPGTVKRHAHNIYCKLSVKDRHDAVSKSKGLGIL